MREKAAVLVPYVVLLGINFYLLPFLIRDTGMAMFLMLCVMPLIAFSVSVVYGVRNGFGILFPIAALVLFIPTIFIHYNATAWVYAPVYAGIVLAGVGLGSLFYRKR